LPELVEGEVAFFAVGVKFHLYFKAAVDGEFGEFSAVEVVHVAQADLFLLAGEDVPPIEEGVAGVKVFIGDIDGAPREDAFAPARAVHELPFRMNEDAAGGEQATHLLEQGKAGCCVRDVVQGGEGEDAVIPGLGQGLGPARVAEVGLMIGDG